MVLSHTPSTLSCSRTSAPSRSPLSLHDALPISSPDLTDALVPSLILQPIVENAIEHGMADRRDIGHVTDIAPVGHAVLDGVLHDRLKDEARHERVRQVGTRDRKSVV